MYPHFIVKDPKENFWKLRPSLLSATFFIYAILETNDLNPLSLYVLVTA